MAMFLGTADAQTSRTAAQAERDRRTEAARAERLRGQEAAAQREVQALDARLVEAARRRSEAEAAATAAEERLAALRLQMNAEAAARRSARDSFESALIAAAFAQRRIEPGAVRAGLFARAAAPAFGAHERRSARALDDAQQVEASIAAEQIVLADAQAAIDEERDEIAGLLTRRRAAQTRLASDAAAAERRVRALAAEARNLRELAQRVQRSAPRPPAGASVVPASWLAPAEGRIAQAFGARDAGGPASQGVLVRTRSGAQVISPAAGEVAYAGEFRSYGQVLILNLDGGYALVLAGLDAVRARVGETVRAGQPVGEMSASATPAPELYVEVRRNGQPVDPGRWLSARGLTAESGARTG
jgi:murein hydrolase activator